MRWSDVLCCLVDEFLRTNKERKICNPPNWNQNSPISVGLNWPLDPVVSALLWGKISSFILQCTDEECYF